MSAQFVVVGVARSRERWFSELAQWSTSGAAPVEFIKCLTAEEVVAIIGSGRRISAVLADARVSGLDRELISQVAEAGAATIVVSDQVTRDWEGLGAAAVLTSGFDRDSLVTALTRCARPVDRSTRRVARARISEPTPAGWLIGVCGARGAGASTVAMAVAQGLGSASSPDGVGPSLPPTTALIDGALVADGAMYHDVGDVIPGLAELVALHRSDEPDPAEVRRLFYEIEERGYSLLLGLRRTRDLSSMRTRSVNAALDGARRAYGSVVVDHDSDLDGERETGSIDVEERHSLARHVADSADLIVMVSRPGLKGIHDITRLIERFTSFGVPPERILPVLNHMPKHAPTRADATRTIAELTGHNSTSATSSAATAAPVFLQPCRRLEDTHRSVTRLPDATVGPLSGRVQSLLAELGPRTTNGRTTSPEQLQIGELASTIDDRVALAEIERRSDVA